MRSVLNTGSFIPSRTWFASCFPLSSYPRAYLFLSTSTASSALSSAYLTHSPTQTTNLSPIIMACDHDSDFQSLLPAIKEAVDRTMALPPADDQSGACILASNRRATILLIGSSPDSCHQALRTHSQNFPFSPDIDTVLFLKNDITNDICSLRFVCDCNMPNL